MTSTWVLVNPSLSKIDRFVVSTGWENSFPAQTPALSLDFGLTIAQPCWTARKFGGSKTISVRANVAPEQYDFSSYESLVGGDGGRGNCMACVSEKKLKNLKDMIIRWRKNTFWNIEKRITAELAKVDELDRKVRGS